MASHARHSDRRCDRLHGQLDHVRLQRRVRLFSFASMIFGVEQALGVARSSPCGQLATRCRSVRCLPALLGAGCSAVLRKCGFERPQAVRGCRAAWISRRCLKLGQRFQPVRRAGVAGHEQEVAFRGAGLRSTGRSAWTTAGFSFSYARKNATSRLCRGNSKLSTSPPKEAMAASGANTSRTSVYFL